ncbi:MAG: iron-containing alcohol dehydrogenase [Lachnospiraceae bacterium]|nr:iron-containing alcohol dehydrogenase [Lachnospiraceae bacterium]
MRLITRYLDDYVRTDIIDAEPASQVQQAAYLAGKAINITQTTAGHALAYKITGTYGCAHGHAVALVMRILILWISEHGDRCIDSRGC